MKRIVSVLTMVIAIISTTLSPVTFAVEKITADEVKDLIYSTGLSAYPELCEETIVNEDEEQDVLKSSTEKLKDITNVEETYAIFIVKKENGKYIVENCGEDSYMFYGYNRDGKVIVIQIEQPGGALTYSRRGDAANEDDPYARIENYEWIAEVINNSEIRGVAEIKVAFYAEIDWTWFIYVKDTEGKEYAFYTEDYPNPYRADLRDDVESIKRGDVLPLDELCKTSEMIDQSFADNVPQFEEIEGDEIRDTQTRLPYIGTESKFTDVSGELVSYVNELTDLGIINGYEDGTFRPDNTITRGEAAAMIARMMKYESEYKDEFLDVSKGDWYSGAVAALTEKGLINGYDETNFAPQSNIKYQEILKILVALLGRINMVASKNFYPAGTNREAIALGLTADLKSFDTTASITRGDMAILLSTALDTHLQTNVKATAAGGVSYYAMQKDITLIDYISGKKLNGKLTTKRTLQ